LARTDQEAIAGKQSLAASGLASESDMTFAYPRFEHAPEMHFIARHRVPDVILTDWALPASEHQDVSTSAALSFHDTAMLHVERAIALLSLGRVVITDRMHGHIFCLLMRIPHILLNNDYGKNWNFHESWTRESPLCHLARNPKDAWSIAEE